MTTTDVTFRIEFSDDRGVYAAAMRDGTVLAVPRIGELLDAGPYGTALVPVMQSVPYRVSMVVHSPVLAGGSGVPEITVVVMVTQSYRGAIAEHADALTKDGWTLQQFGAV